VSEADGRAVNRLLWLTGLAVLGVAGTGVWAATSARAPRSDDPCAEQTTVLSELWDDDAKLRLAERVEALGPEFDPDGMVAEFDAWVAAWTWTRIDACRRAEADGRHFDALAPAALCLQRRSERFAAAIDLIRDGELEVAKQAQAFVAALEDPAPCLDHNYIRYELPLPPSPGRLVPALVMQQRLAEVELLMAGGLDKRARERIAEIEDAVAESGHLPSIAKFELLRFENLTQQERRHPAELQRITEAVGVAERAGADPLAARLLVAQLETLGHQHPMAALVETYAEGKVIRSDDAFAAEALARWRARR
jgi:transposase